MEAASPTFPARRDGLMVAHLRRSAAQLRELAAVEQTA